jgi:hypothetical protein
MSDCASALSPGAPFESETNMDEVNPFLGGAPGEPVPIVDPEDVKAVWQIFDEIRRTHPNQAVGVAGLVAVCGSGANIPAVTLRAGMIGLVLNTLPAELAPWTKEDRVDDAVFRAIAQVPMEWLGVGIERQGWPFDVEDFMRRVRAG